MYIRSFVSVLIVTSSFILAFGQMPETKKESEEAPKAFAWSFDGEGGYLGVQTAEVNKENFGKFGLREVRGVAVEKVRDNSPAAAAGIQNNDVIVRFNGEEITSTRKLSRLVSEVAPDHQVTLTVLRNGREKDITAMLGKRQTPQLENGNFSTAVPGALRQLQVLPDLRELPEGEMPSVLPVPPGGAGQNFVWRTVEGRQIGISVYPVTKQLGERFGVDGGDMINNVREDSPAAKAGLKAGDIIVEVDGKTVKNNLDLMRAINDKKDGDVQLTIVRDRNRQTIIVTPEAAKDGGFFFQNGGGDGLAPRPGQMRLPIPATPATPMSVPAPMTFVRPARVI